jgi:hypothetical protein
MKKGPTGYCPLCLDITEWKREKLCITCSCCNNVMDTYLLERTQEKRYQMRKMRALHKIGKHPSRHHLTPKSLGGCDEYFNILFLDWPKHAAWHILFELRTLDEVIEYLEEHIPHGAPVYFTYFLSKIFYRENLKEIIQVLVRIKDMKERKRRSFVYLLKRAS